MVPLSPSNPSRHTSTLTDSTTRRLDLISLSDLPPPSSLASLSLASLRSPSPPARPWVLFVDL
uniref:Uncharacterized protein n=1 Tax=Fagus sylvatica TaxID=28930 RepID=A0A2N9FV50_FAGSY